MAKPNSVLEIELLEAVRAQSIKKTQQLLPLYFIQFDDRLFDYYLILEALDNHQIDLAKLLVGRGCRVYKPSKSTSQRTVLHAVLCDSSSDIAFITELLEKGASLDILALDEDNETPFHLAIHGNHSAVTKLFLSQPQLNIKALDEKYLLHYAIEQGISQVVLQLITKGLSLTQKDETGSTPFCVALRGKDFKILDSLFSHLSVKNIDSNNYDDVAPVYVASIYGNLKFIRQYTDYGLPINNPLELSTGTWSCLKDYPGFTLLHLAVKYTKLEVVGFLLSMRSNVIAQNDSGSSPLHLAFETKILDSWKSSETFLDNNSIINLVLKYSTKYRSNPVNKHGLSHFHIACSRNDPTVVERFLKLGASVNEPVKSEDHNYKKFPPLHFAVKFGSEKIVEILLKNGADIKQRNSEGMTALHIAAKKSCLNVVHLLLKYGADIASADSQGNTPVHLAFQSNNYEIIDLLLSVPNVTASSPTNIEGISHFHIACTRKDVKVVKSFIESGASINTCITVLSQDSDFSHLNGYSPLHLAVSHNRATIVQVLLRSGANVEIKDHKGHIPLHVACLYTYQMFGEFIKITLCNLVKHGKIDLTKKPLTDKEHFGEASGSIEKINWSSNRVQHMKVIDLLLSNRSDVNCIDNTGNTPVFYAYDGCTNNKIRSILANELDCSVALWTRIGDDLSQELCERRILILNRLMKLDVKLDKCCEKGSILHAIISNSDFSDKQRGEMMEKFLKKGVNINSTDDDRLTPLHWAVMNENENLLKILLHYGADVDCLNPSDNSTPLLTAATQLGPWSYRGIMKILIDNKADVNARRSDGRTALHIVVSRHRCHGDSVIASLIKAGADVNSQDNSGITALHLACRQECEESMKLLLQFGADINVEDFSENTVAYYLCENRLCMDCDCIHDAEGNIPEEVQVLHLHLLKLDSIGLPVSEIVSSAISEYSRLSEAQQLEFIGECETEVKILQDPKIFSSNKCTLYDVIFKNENSMSKLVKNPAFEAIVQSKSIETKCPIYGYLIPLKYWEGVRRANLLPTANVYLDSLVGMHIPEVCSENIFKHFNNVELRKTTDILQRMLELKIENSNDNMQLRSHNTRKRQKVNLSSFQLDQ